MKVVVASHKPYWTPADPVYLPVQVHACDALPIDGFLPDCTGENISAKNPNYCELTALYWAWKNLECDALGLAHYRRYFAGKNSGGRKERVATGEQLAAAVSQAGIVLPRRRNYFIETNYTQYAHAHHEEDLIATREIIAQREPGGIAKYDEIMGRTYGHRFNMFVMRRDLADAWCEWLFDILFELEGKLDISSYSANDARVFGFVSERLIDYWVESRGLSYVEMPVVNLENQHWMQKGRSFLKRKLQGSAASRDGRNPS